MVNLRSGRVGRPHDGGTVAAASRRGLTKATRAWQLRAAAARPVGPLQETVSAITRPVAYAISQIVCRAFTWSYDLLQSLSAALDGAITAVPALPEGSAADVLAAGSDARPMSWGGHRVPVAPLTLLPFDVLGAGVLPFLSECDLSAFRSCCSSTKSAVDKYSEIWVRQLLGWRVGRGAIPVGRMTEKAEVYRPVGERFNQYLLARFMMQYGDLILAQKHQVDPLYMTRLQGVHVLGKRDYVEPAMRTCLADWLLEVASEYNYPFSAWHEAMMRLDVFLSNATTTRPKLQLVGCVCLSIEASRLSVIRPISVADVVSLCDDQYEAAEVQEVVSHVLEHTEAKLSLSPGNRVGLLTIQDCALCYFLRVSTPVSRFVHHTLHHAESFYDVGDNEEEQLVFVLLLSNLAVVDYDLLQYSPFTIAAAVVFLVNLMMHHYGKANVLIGSFGHVLTCSSKREIQNLGGPQRPFLTPKRNYLQEPFGFKMLQNYVMSAPQEERVAIVRSVERLWMMHSDFLWHTYYTGDTSERNDGVLLVRYHLNIFRGLVRQLAQQHSCRFRVWGKLGPLPWELVSEHCSELLSSNSKYALG